MRPLCIGESRHARQTGCGRARACIHGEAEAIDHVGALALALNGVDGGDGAEVDWSHRMHHAQMLVVAIAVLCVQLRGGTGGWW